MSKELIVAEKPIQWVHYTGDDADIVMFDREQTDHFKPHGLWITPYGMKDNWFDWAMAEEFRIEELNYVHDVVLKPTCNLLRVNSAEGIDQISEKYATIDLFEGKYATPYWQMDWRRMAEDYQGILIEPYIWERRLYRGPEGKENWYYTWDCASGCIWSADAIESITIRSRVSAGHVGKPKKSIEYEGIIGRDKSTNWAKMKLDYTLEVAIAVMAPEAKA